MTTVDITVNNRKSASVVVQTPQPTVPASARPPDIGMVELSTSTIRGAMWFAGEGDPVNPGQQPGDMYMDLDTGNIWKWDGQKWLFEGTLSVGEETPEEILAKLLTVDGTGSGLDADTLDSHDSTYFATDADMTAAEASITQINLDIDALTQDDIDQDGLITDLTERVDTIDTEQDVQDGRLTAVESKNTAQDAAIATKIGDAPVDGKQYARKDATWSEFVAGDPLVPTQDAPPASPKDGQLWWDSDAAILYVFYDDGDSQQWVQTQPSIKGDKGDKGDQGNPGTPAATTDPYPFPTADMQLKSGLTGKVILNDKANGTGRDAITLASVGGSSAVVVNKAAGNSANINGKSNGVDRWVMELGTNLAESGADAGSDFAIHRYNDAGTYVGNPIHISRATGAVSCQGILAAGEVRSAQNFSSSSGVAIMAAVGAGGAIYLRPNGAGDATGELNMASNGSVVMSNVFQGFGSRCRSGISGGAQYVPNFHNIFYTAGDGFNYLFIDNTNMGRFAFASDYRLKKDVADLPSTWDTVKALRPIQYTAAEFDPPWEQEARAQSKQADPDMAVTPAPMFHGNDAEQWGFIAHELQETLVESAATGHKDIEGAIQSPNPWPVLAALTKALQEAQQRIEALEAMLVP